MVNRQGVEQMSFSVRREHRFPGELPRHQIEGEQSRASVIGFFVSHHVGNRGCRRVEKPSRLVDSQRVAGQEAVLTRMNEIGTLPRGVRRRILRCLTLATNTSPVSGSLTIPVAKSSGSGSVKATRLRMSGLRSAA